MEESTLEVAEVPRFCPGCGRDGASTDALCKFCGDRLQPRGYCPVCDATVKAPPGASCPKHEIPLLEGPPAERLDAPDAGTDWVTLRSFAHPFQAQACRLRLEAEGIPAQLDGERMGNLTIYNVATGGIRLRVPRNLAADARVLLAQTLSAWKAEPPIDDLDDAWDDLAPESGTELHAVGGRIALIGLALAMAVGLGALAWSSLG